MNKRDIIDVLTALDRGLAAAADLYVYGSAVVILLDAPGRTSLDIDVAGAYSTADQAELAQVAERAGCPVNPDPTYDGPHIEWVGPLRLCLPPPGEGGGMVLWRGSRLTVRTGTVEDIVASKLIRYDLGDRSDIQFLHSQTRFTADAVAAAVLRLPGPFRTDLLVRENLENLRRDLRAWEGVV